MGPVLQGILVGLTFAVLLGPAFFALIQTSIQRGFKIGVFLALGIFISDLSALVLSYFGAVQLLGSDPRENIYFSIIGGIILIIFGTYTFMKKGEIVKPEEQKELQIKAPRPIIYIIKGFLLNAANPGMWFIWITTVVSTTSRYGVNSKSNYIFLAAALGTIFLTDVLKCYVSGQLKKFITARILTIMNRLVGIVLVGFGTYLIINVLVDLEAMLIIYDNWIEKLKQ
jgi:threonine/homoserine/homoserine lactone efflux protein